MYRLKCTVDYMATSLAYENVRTFRRIIDNEEKDQMTRHILTKSIQAAEEHIRF